MKKYIFMAVAGMLALSSCSNDDNDVQNTQNAPRQMTFTAAFGDKAQTRTTLDGTKVSFDAGDAISILSASNDNVEFTTSEGGASASFDGWAGTDPTYYAVYPYTTGLTLDTSTGIISGVKIPDFQENAAMSTCGWDPAAPIAYATTTGTSLQFHNACALLKINNDRGDAGNIVVMCNEALTGTFSLDTSNGALTGSQAFPDASAGSVPDDKTIYIAIAPGEKHDFSAYWMGMDYSEAKKEKMSVTFEAGKIYDLGKTSEWND